MEKEALWALIIALLSTVSLPLGSLLGMLFRPRAGLVGALAAFGGGALLAALSVELVAPTMLAASRGPTERLLAVALLGGGVLGGLFFWILDQLLNARGGYLRKTATAIGYLGKRRVQRLRRLLRRLAANPLFRQIPPQRMAPLLDRLHPVSFAPGEVLFREGSEGDRLYLIEAGAVDLERRGSPIVRLGAGEVVGEIALVTGGGRTATATAVEEITAMALLREDFDALCRQVPELGAAFQEMAGRRLEDLGRRDARTATVAAEWAVAAARALRTGQRLPTPAELRREAERKSAAPLAIWLGITLDGIPECFVLGATVLDTIHRQAGGGVPTLWTVIPYTFLIGLVLSNLPEALSSSVGLLNQGWKRRNILLLWGSLVVIGAALTMLGFWFGEDVPPVVEIAAEGMAAGAMLTMIAQTMIPEAVHLGGANVVGLSTLAGFLLTVAFKLIEA